MAEERVEKAKKKGNNQKIISATQKIRAKVKPLGASLR
jgi:hypothetical protein